MPESREHDIVVFGATGYTGALTAEQLARHTPETTRWALAGRNQGKLEAARERLAAINSACAGLPLLRADVSDEGSLREVAESAGVVITTVGPYLKYGEPLVAACAKAGTDYVDLTGEPEFVDRMYLSHHATAADSGARIIHSCGFDSIPHDLGAYFTVQQLPQDAPIALRGYVRAGGRPSGGTLQSAVGAMSRLREAAAAHRERRGAEPPPTGGRQVRGLKRGPHYERSISTWALPMPSIDPQVVMRSASALDRYGPEFSYGHFMAVKHLPVAAGLAGGVGGLVLLTQLPPVRSWLEGRLQSGQGPTPEQRAKGWFKVRFIGEADGQHAAVEVAGGDPGYGETSVMLSEAALCLAHDDLPESAGQVTPAVAMGNALIDRLRDRGIKFSVLEPGG